MRRVLSLSALLVLGCQTTPSGGVRQQDIDDNMYLATTLAKIRQDQLARDEEKLTLRSSFRRRCARRGR
jgi:hypothetical protein